MGVRDFTDSMSELMRVMQLRNYFTQKQPESTSSSHTQNNKLKQNILKNKVNLYPTKDKQGYSVSGENILKVKKELKDIGAYWNEENKAVEISNDSYVNNIDKETKAKIEKDIAEKSKDELNIIRQKIINNDLNMISEGGKYKAFGYTNDIKDILENLGFEKLDGSFYINKQQFKELFSPEITKLVDIFNNEYTETTSTPEEKKSKTEKFNMEVCIVDRSNKGHNKWIQLPISRLNFSKLANEFNSNNLQITKIKSNDRDIQKLFEDKTFLADTDTIHKFNVLTRKLNDLSNDKLQEYKSVLTVEGLSNIKDFIKCADELKTEQIMEIN